MPFMRDQLWYVFIKMKDCGLCGLRPRCRRILDSSIAADRVTLKKSDLKAARLYKSDCKPCDAIDNQKCTPSGIWEIARMR